MSGEMPDRYRRHILIHEAIEGIDHHWVWSPGGIHRSRFRRASNYAVFAASAAIRAVTLPRPDVVLVSSPPLTVAPIGPLLARRFRCPWVLEVRDIWPESAVSVGWLQQGSFAYKMLERIAHRTTSHADMVLVPTPALEPLVRAHGARSATTLTGAISPRPVDELRRSAARASLDLTDAESLFLYLGAIGVANGLDMLIEAVKLLPRAFRLGSSSPATAALGTHSLRPSRPAGSGGFTLLPPMPRDKMDDLLAAADVGLHLLRPDPVFESALPSKVLDYLARVSPSSRRSADYRSRSRSIVAAPP